MRLFIGPYSQSASCSICAFLLRLHLAGSKVLGYDVGAPHFC